MVDLYVPKPELEAERKLREAAEEQLQKVLEYLDPQPDSKGGLIYGAPFPQSGDLARRLLALVDGWEREDRKLDGGFVDARVEDRIQQLRKALCGYLPRERTEDETKGGIIIPQAPAVCPTCGRSKGEMRRLREQLDQLKDPGRATLGMRPVVCETCGETHLEEIL